jgi:hypothetical protein
MTTIDDAKRLCRKLEIKIISTADRPGPMRTSAVNTIRRMLAERGQEHIVVVLRAITEGNPANRAMLREDVIRAISDVVRAHPRWPERGGIWLEAWDSVDLVQIRHSAKASGIRPLRFAIGALVCLRLTEILGPSVLPKPKPVKAKLEPKVPRSHSRIPEIERNIALGRELLELKAKTKSNREFGRERRRLFDIDGQHACEVMKVARVYGGRPEIYSRLSWNALLHLASRALSAPAREVLEHRIVAGEHIGGPEIRAARGALKARRSPQPAISGSRRSGRSSFQTVDGVHGGHVTPHQVSDCAVHQPLSLERAHAGEHGRRHVDIEMSPAAVDCGL